MISHCSPLAANESGFSPPPASSDWRLIDIHSPAIGGKSVLYYIDVVVCCGFVCVLCVCNVSCVYDVYVCVCVCSPASPVASHIRSYAFSVGV